MSSKPSTDVALLAGLFTVSGAIHLVRPDVFRPLMPAFVPAHLHSLRVLHDRPGPLAVAVARLPLQVPMLQAALRVSRDR